MRLARRGSFIGGLGSTALGTGLQMMVPAEWARDVGFWLVVIGVVALIISGLLKWLWPDAVVATESTVSAQASGSASPVTAVGGNVHGGLHYHGGSAGPPSAPKPSLDFLQATVWGMADAYADGEAGRLHHANNPTKLEHWAKLARERIRPLGVSEVDFFDKIDGASPLEKFDNQMARLKLLTERHQERLRQLNEGR